MLVWMTTLESTSSTLDLSLYLREPPVVPVPGVTYVAAYARLSKDKRGELLGVMRQLEDVVPVIVAEGHVPVIYVDNDKSATSGVRRPDYQRMHADVAAGKLHTVACYDNTRLFRDNLEQEIFMRLASEIELAPLLFVHGGAQDLCDYSDQMVFRVQGAVSARHVAEMKAKLKRSHDQRAKLGRAFWPCRPFGFERPKRDGTGAIHRDDEAALIKQAYQDVLRGRSMKEIAREWNALGVRTPTRENVDGVVTSGGNEWSGMAIRALLLCARNAGLRERSVMRGGKRVKLDALTKADWDAIVDEDLYHGVVALLKSRTRTTNSWVRRHLLTSLLVCDKCKGTMTTHQSSVASVRPARRPTYVCARPGCYGVKRSMPDVDRHVEQLVGDRLSAPDAKGLCRREKLDATFVSSVEEKIASLLNVRKLQSKLAINGELSADECEENVAEINAKIALLRDEITEPASAEVLEDVVKADDPRAYFDDLPLDRKRAIIDYLMTITILPGQGARQPFNEDLVVVDWKHPYEPQRATKQ